MADVVEKKPAFYSKYAYSGRVYYSIDLETKDVEIVLRPDWDEIFNDLKDLIKRSNFKWSSDRGKWVGDIYCIESFADLMKKFFDCDEIEIPSEAKLTAETVFKRRAIDRTLLKADPLGPFQEEGILKGIQQNRLLLGWEMGLGKTYVVVSILNHRVKYDGVDRTLIVAPSESVYNFKRELLRFNTFGLTEDDISIANVKNRNPWEKDPKIIIMTYRTFLMLSDEFYRNTTGKTSKNYRTPCLPFDTWGSKRTIVLDESHLIKNITSRTSKVLNIHKQFFDFRYLLSGTPFPNGVHELYNQLRFIDPTSVNPNYNQWLSEIANIGNRWSQYGINYFYPKKVEKFIQQKKKWVDRKFTKGNIDLPDLVVDKIYVGMNDKHEQIYQDLVEYVLYILKERDGRIIPREVFIKFPFIMQAIDDPSLLKGKMDPQMNPRFVSRIEKWKMKDHSKLEVVSSLLEKYIETEKRKVILWSGHPLTMDTLAVEYAKYNPIVIHGQSEIPKNISMNEHRNNLLEKFKTGKKNNLLIASYFVLSSAVNIVESNRAVYWDRSWDLKYYLQSIKRNHRIGQTEIVFSHPTILEGTIDERLDKTLDQKENLNNNLFNRDSLSLEEWKNIFKGVS